MPISEDEYREPSWIRYRKGYTIARDTNQRSRFMVFSDYPRSYRGEGGNIPEPGYNPHQQSTRVERINLYTDDITLKPR
jgi:hypothetical protein